MRALTLLLILAAAVPAERQLITFRLRSDPRAPVRGWLESFTEDTFTYRAFGGRKARVRWDALVKEDSHALRRKVGLELSEREKKGLIAGHRLYFKAGGSIDGLLVRVDAGKRHWVKRFGALIPYPGDQVVKVEDVEVKDNDVFSPDELYRRRLERTTPQTARQHREFATHMERVGNFEKAREHYRKAMIIRPAWTDDIAPRLKDLEALMADKEAAELVRAARKSANLDKNFKRAREKIEQFLRDHPGRKRQGLAMLDDIDRQQHEERSRRFFAVKHEEFDRLVDKYVLRKETLRAAQNWVRVDLPGMVKKKTIKRLGLSEDEWAEFKEAESRATPHRASYGAGSFTVNRRAKVGKSSSKVVRGDPGVWWETNRNPGSRASYLKAYAAEKLPQLFTVVSVRHTDCPMCGGRGFTKHSSINPLANGKHEFRVVCRRCYGAKHDRGVAYK